MGDRTEYDSLKDFIIMALSNDYQAFKNVITDRRSIYALNADLPVSEDDITSLVEELAELTPDAFNQKSARAIVVFGDKNQQVWDAIYDAFEGKVSREKIDSFAAGAGTILYFIDRSTIQSMQAQYELYADKFPIWANQANGMLQFNIWSALRSVGVGASLQHYNPVIVEAIREVTGAPEAWELVAQAPFGGIAAEPEPKEGEDISQRVWVQR